MKQFKNIIPFRQTIPSLVAAVSGDLKHLKALHDVLANHPIQDPRAGEWGRIGFLGNDNGDMYYANESALLLMVSIRERILPGPVLKAEVEKRAARLAERQGRRCTKKEIAMLRDDAEAALLPKSHIKETFVPVILRQKWMMVCTSSHKRADEVTMLLMRTLADTSIFPVETVNSPAAWMTDIAVNGTDEENVFSAGEAINLVGHDEAKGTVSFKGEDVTSHRVSDLITSEGYTATKMQLATDDMKFTLSPSMILSGIKFHDTFLEGRVQQDKDDARAVFDSNLTMVAMAYHDLLKNLVTSLGGLKEVQTPEPEATDTPSTNEPVADANGTERKLTYWQDAESGEVFAVRSSDEEPASDVAIQITHDQFELEGGEIGTDDELWLRGEGPFERTDGDLDQGHAEDPINTGLHAASAPHDETDDEDDEEL
ncbi:putative exonuclease [Achromobacter phage AXY1]|nr:putative exonuclease [Achromobacter phage AXY1]